MNDLLKYGKKVGWPIVILFVFFLLDPFELGYLAGYLLVPIMYTRREFLSKNLDSDFFILFLFSLVYALFYFFQPQMLMQTFLFYLLFPPVFYLLGKYFVTKAQNVHQLYMLFLTVGILFSFTALVSVSFNLLEGGFVQKDRTLSLFWNGQIKTATLMAAYFSFNMCIPALIIAGKAKFNLMYKLVVLGLFVISLLCVFRLGSRTQIGVCAVTTVLATIYMIPNQTAKQNLKLILVVAFSVAIVYMYIPLSLDADYLSVLGDRLQAADSSNTGTAGNRTQRWAKSLENLFAKPFGWGRNEFGYSHNLWLDVAQANGIFPFFLLLFFTVKSFLKTKKAVFLGNLNLSFRSMILSFYIAANLLFFVEPVMLGAFFMFVLYCFFQGAINKYLFYIQENRHLLAKQGLQSKKKSLRPSSIPNDI